MPIADPNVMNEIATTEITHGIATIIRNMTAASVSMFGKISKE